jgi:3-phosphoshikimate 1-carboxyvinyltransferase
MKDNLERLGAVISIENSEVTIQRTVNGGSRVPRAVTAAGDHRIAMAMAVTALGAGPLELDDPATVTKSFPNFWTQWKRLLGSGEGEGPVA